jgi:hypothetical protein
MFSFWNLHLSLSMNLGVGQFMLVIYFKYPIYNLDKKYFGQQNDANVHDI